MVATFRAPEPALSARRSAAAGAPLRAAAAPQARRSARSVVVLAERTVLIGLAADSGCGKARRAGRARRVQAPISRGHPERATASPAHGRCARRARSCAG